MEAFLTDSGANFEGMFGHKGPCEEKRVRTMFAHGPLKRRGQSNCLYICFLQQSHAT
jgi:hypothetical protein